MKVYVLQYIESTKYFDMIECVQVLGVFHTNKIPKDIIDEFSGEPIDYDKAELYSYGDGGWNLIANVHDCFKETYQMTCHTLTE